MILYHNTVPNREKGTEKEWLSGTRATPAPLASLLPKMLGAMTGGQTL